MSEIGRNPCSMHKVVGWCVSVSATPSGMGSIGSISTRRDRSGVMQTLEPESAIGVARCMCRVDVCGVGVSATIPIGIVC